MKIRICNYDTNYASEKITIRLKSGKLIFNKTLCEECAKGLILITSQIRSEEI